VEASFLVVGRFVRIVRKDGVLLFKPTLRDSRFLSRISHLYHSLFQTEFTVSSITKTAKGFHVRIAEVEKPYEAEYLVGEEFSLPRKEIVGETLDALIGLPVTDTNGDEIGTVTAVSETPLYPILTIQGNGAPFDVPFTSDTARVDGERIVLSSGERHAH